MPANIRRLVELGMPSSLAKEVATSITAGTVSATSLRRLSETGMVPRHIRELRAQLAGVKNAKRWVELGLAPSLARELVAQMTA
jgi:hypothetical protein